MSTSENLRAKAVQVTEGELVVVLADGSRHAVPLGLFPILAEATPGERARWELLGGGVGIHWPELDEHVSVFSVVHPERTVPMRAGAVERHLARNRRRRSVTLG
jgi:hypothetical protein